MIHLQTAFRVLAGLVVMLALIFYALSSVSLRAAERAQQELILANQAAQACAAFIRKEVRRPGELRHPGGHDALNSASLQRGNSFTVTDVWTWPGGRRSFTCQVQELNGTFQVKGVQWHLKD